MKTDEVIRIELIEKKIPNALIVSILGTVIMFGTIIGSYFFGGIEKKILYSISTYLFLALAAGYVVFLVLYHKYKYKNDLNEITRLSATVNNKFIDFGKEITNNIIKTSEQSKKVLDKIRTLQAEILAEKWVVDDDKLIKLEEGAKKIYVGTSSLKDYELNENEDKYFLSIKNNIKNFGTEFRYILPKDEKENFTELREKLIRELESEDKSKDWDTIVKMCLKAVFVDSDSQYFPFISGFEYIHNSNSKEEENGRKKIEFCFFYIPRGEEKYNFDMDKFHREKTIKLFSKIWTGDSGRYLNKIAEL